jgi:hypothetical protein
MAHLKSVNSFLLEEQHAARVTFSSYYPGHKLTCPKDAGEIVAYPIAEG